VPGWPAQQTLAGVFGTTRPEVCFFDPGLRFCRLFALFSVLLIQIRLVLTAISTKRIAFFNLTPAARTFAVCDTGVIPFPSLIVDLISVQFTVFSLPFPVCFPRLCISHDVTPYSNYVFPIPLNIPFYYNIFQYFLHRLLKNYIKIFRMSGEFTGKTGADNPANSVSGV
jgi:hypothetical protein